MYTLKTNRLRVDVSTPGVPPNTTTRFDRSGFIEEVVLDGVHRFCASEPRNLSHKSSGGRGICNEYKASVDSEAPVGGYFMKPGVGLLLKETDEPYKFMNDYKSKPFKIDVAQDGNALLFVTQPSECGGYALRQEKRVAADGNRLDVTVTLENAGERFFSGEEYCHNFITVNCMSLGPDYTLTFPSGRDRGITKIEGELYAAGNGFTFTGPLKAPRFFEMGAAEFALEPGAAFEWIFGNSAEGAQVRVCERINLSRVAIWAADHMFSTESFHAIELAPGESDTWTRSWVFETI